MGKGKEKDPWFRDWPQLNNWRWEFLRISPAYNDFFSKYKELPAKDINHIQAVCFSHFNLILTEKHEKARQLPDPNKDIKTQIVPVFFYDYYYPLYRQSLLMTQFFGEKYNKPCVEITRFSDKEIIACKKRHSLGSFAVTESSGQWKQVIGSARIVPGISLFAIDINIPVGDLISCLENEILSLKKKFRRDTEAAAHIDYRYYIPKKQWKNQKFNEWEKYHAAYKIYLEVLKEYDAVSSKTDILDESRQKLKKHYQQHYHKKISDRQCNEWRRNGEALMIAASKGFFPCPD